jgi:hypothetical protein
MARGKQHDDQTRAQVIAALLAGQSISQVAGEYKLPDSTVRGWANGIGDELAKVRDKKREQFGDLIGDYLKESLTTLSVQQEHFRDKTWLQKQPAEALAVLHGVTADKAIRILEALETTDEPE